MTKLYILGVICGLVLFGYMAGISRGHEKCVKNITQKNAEILQQQNLKKENLNAEIYRTGVNDIRHILRTKYTIAD